MRKRRSWRRHRRPRRFALAGEFARIGCGSFRRRRRRRRRRRPGCARRNPRTGGLKTKGSRRPPFSCREFARIRGGSLPPQSTDRRTEKKGGWRLRPCTPPSLLHSLALNKFSSRSRSPLELEGPAPPSRLPGSTGLGCPGPHHLSHDAMMTRLP